MDMHRSYRRMGKDRDGHAWMDVNKFMDGYGWIWMDVGKSVFKNVSGKRKLSGPLAKMLVEKKEYTIR